MPLAEASFAEDLKAELSALRQEKSYLVTEIKSDSVESKRKLEAMIRYSVVISEIRAVILELRERGAAVA